MSAIHSWYPKPGGHAISASPLLRHRRRAAPPKASCSGEATDSYHHFSGRAEKPARSSITRPAFSTPCRSEEHTSELQSLMRISYAVFCLNKTKNTQPKNLIRVTLTN